VEKPSDYIFSFFRTKNSHYHFPFKFRCNAYFILLSVEATNFDLFKSYLKNINYVIHFNQNEKFSDDCVVTGNKFGIIFIITFLFVWNTRTNNRRKKTWVKKRCRNIKL